MSIETRLNSPAVKYLRLSASHDEEWDSWEWQLAHTVSSPAALGLETEVDSEAARQFRMAATPFYLSLARALSPSDPVMAQCLPRARELADGGEEDPLGEGAASPVPRLVHRYRDRALFVSCGSCAVHCRHCMRKRGWDAPLGAPRDEELAFATGYLRAHPEVREVLVSGGDPLTLPDADLGRILEAFGSVPSIEVIRIGTRALAALPMRVTAGLCSLLEGCSKTVWVATHFNHPQELSVEAAAAAKALVRSGVCLVNQSVLLKGINDSAEILGALFTGLLKIRIKPYYLFHGDPVRGAMCFRTGVGAGVQIMSELRRQISGLALPAYAFDLPDGGGKVRLEPDSSAGTDTDGTPLYRRMDGGTSRYK